MYRVYADDLFIYGTDIPDQDYHLLNPQLKRSIGKVSQFNFTILPRHPLYAQIERMKTIIRIEEDGNVIFRGRILDWSSDMRKAKKCVAEDALAYLNDSYLEVLNETMMTPEAFFRRCIAEHNSQCPAVKQLTVGTVQLDETSNRVFEISSPTDTMSVISSDLVSVYGGYVRIRYTASQTYIDYIQRFTDHSTQAISFASNLIDLSEQQSGDELFSILLPIGQEDIRISSSVQTRSETLPNGTVIQTTAGEPYIRIPSAIQKYGVIYHAESFGDVGNAATLLVEAKRYIQNNYLEIPSTFTVKALDLKLIGESTDGIWEGILYPIQSAPHGLNHDYLCESADIDFQSPENSSFTFADPNKQSNSGTNYQSLSTQNSETNDSVNNQINDLYEEASNTKKTIEVVKKDVEDVQEQVDDQQEQLDEQEEALEEETANRTAAIAAATAAWNGKLEQVQGDLYSRIEMTASNIRAEVADTKNQAYSRIEMTASYIRAEVSDAKNQAYSRIEQTASYIRMDVADVKNQAYSRIEQTASYIRAEVSDAKNQAYSRIEQTASYIRTEVSDAKNQAYSRIEQTANSIRISVNDVKNQAYSRIDQTASSIRLEVSNVKNQAYSRIDQTASGIRLEVSNVKNQAYSRIDQTASGIRLEVSNVKNQAYSRIDVTANSIRLGVSDTANNLRSAINVQRDRISLVVSGTGSTAKIDVASIVASVNNAGSTVTINASHILIGSSKKTAEVEINAALTRISNIETNYLKADTVTANWLSSKIAGAASLTAGSIICNSLTVGNQAISATNITSLVSGSVATDGTVTLKGYRPNGASYDIATFNSAASVTLTGSWSGATYTAKASNNKSVSVTISMSSSVHQNGDSSYVSVSVSASPGGVRLSNDVMVGSVYTAGYNTGHTDGIAAYYDSGYWTKPNGEGNVYVPNRTNTGSEVWFTVSYPKYTSYGYRELFYKSGNTYYQAAGGAHSWYYRD